uniref:DNA topoisomerase n=1 Tax=viral metagenome TaxID=1070528 RepID=A0A6M3Y6F7_9ZZZZ
MPKIEYEAKRFRQEALSTIAQAEEIIKIYQAQGFSLTLRQLYYQFVARALIPNTEKSYTRLGNIISDARRAGLIDWDAIVDRTRYLRKLSSWDKPQSILESARDSYHRDLWANQDRRIEVWIEKDALVGVIEDICQENDVPFFSCRGYVSDSEMWAGAMRTLKWDKKRQGLLILHLGDHDPSGIDMTRDIENRLKLFSYEETELEIKRIALTMEQIEELNPPPNPAKVTDSRYEGYAAEYGMESWELDALEPRYIVDLIKENILDERDEDKWQELIDEQEAERKQIATVIKKWNTLF